MRNLEGRDPIEGRDDIYMSCLRRANIDAMLGKSLLTIANHAWESKGVIRNAELINKTPSYFMIGDPVGMGVAVDMQVKSITARGRILLHVQFATLRHLRSTHTKSWESSPLGVAEGASFAKGLGRIRPTSCASQSEWFYDFL